MRLLVILLLCLAPFADAFAQGDIHRCIGKDGNAVFTDRVCSDVNATPFVPAPPSSVAPAAPAPSGPVAPPPILCAMDARQLKQAVIAAFADRNPNRLAGLMLWNGDDGKTVVDGVRALSRLMQHPLLNVSDAPATSSSLASPPPDPDLSDAPPPLPSPPAHSAGPMLTVHTESDDGSGQPQTTQFAIIHRYGCLWLQQAY